MRRLILIAIIGLTLAACQMKMEQATIVNEDGSGTITAFMGFDEEMMSLVGQDGTDPFEDLESDIPEGFTAERVTEGKFQGVRISGDFTSLEDFKDKAASLTQDGEGLEGDYSITREGDVFSFKADMQGFDMSDLGDASQFEGVDLAALFDISVSVKLPGEVKTHNADEVRSDGTLVWKLMAGGSPETFEATSELGGGGNTTMLLAIIGGVILLAAIAYLLTRKKGAPALDTTGSGPLDPPSVE